MLEHHFTVLQFVADNGPCGCKKIMDSTGLNRRQVYQFLYKSRCYGDGKGWIDNIKVLPDLHDPDRGRIANSPGRYTITAEGIAELLFQQRLRRRQST